jgi:hypothetical protein
MDTFHLALASKAWREERWPLVIVYLNGSDILAEAPLTPPENRVQRLVRDRSLVDHLEWLDRQVSATVAAALRGISSWSREIRPEHILPRETRALRF